MTESPGNSHRHPLIRTELLVRVDTLVVRGWAELDGGLVTVKSGLGERRSPLGGNDLHELGRTMLAALVRSEIVRGLR